MAFSSTIPTKFLVISDTHNFDFDNRPGRIQPLRRPTPKVDVLLHCGDLTDDGGVSSFRKAVRMLGDFDAELKLIVAGNHDLELDKCYWKSNHDSRDHDLAVETMTGPLAHEAGVVYLNEGAHSFVLKSGAKFTIYVSPHTPQPDAPKFCNWAFSYEHGEDRFSRQHQVADGIVSIATNPIPDDVDIVMTHGPPKGILDWIPQGNVGCPNLLQAIRRVKPRMHCFGHVHDGHGVEIIDWKKKLTIVKPPSRKNEAVHRFFEEDPEENPYLEPFMWNEARGEKHWPSTLPSWRGVAGQKTHLGSSV